VDASFTDVSSDFESAFGPSTSGTRRVEARLQEDVAIVPALSASAGVQLLRERGSSSFITGPAAETIPIERSVTGAYGELRFVGGERLFVTGGLRLERLERSAVEADPRAFVPRPAFPAQTVSSWNPKVAASYLLTRPGGPRATRLRASAGTGIRPPDAFEIAFTDNPDLAPERSRSVDAGIEQQFDGGALLASYTFLSTEVLSVDGLERLAPAPFQVGDALIRRPRHQGLIEATYVSSRMSAFADLTLRSQILDLEPNYGSFGGLFFSAGYSVLNAGVSIPIRRGVEVYARGLNLADRSYEETLGYPALGRSAMVGVRVAAGR
jgi:iron complex outermembrane receptor protein